MLIYTPLSGRRKSSPAAIFSDETFFPCAFGTAGEECKETLLRKASEADAHVVSFGLKVGGLRPSDTSQRVYQPSERGVYTYIHTSFVVCFDSICGRTVKRKRFPDISVKLY